MLEPPTDAPDLVDVLAREWGVTVSSLDYVPVGYGSHHWSAGDWFVNLDEPADPGELWSALSAAVALDRDFVLAPRPTLDGAPLARVGRFAVSLYPFVAGESFAYGEFPSGEHQRAVLELVAAIHTSGVPAAPEDLTIECRAELEATLADGMPDTGPYSAPAARLISECAPTVRRLLARYDSVVTAVDPTRAVLTHGEPHPGNTMRTADGWLLIDWETARLAQPERDLWLLGDLRAYTAATGIEPVPELLELYALRWNLSDLGYELSRFRVPHTGTPADDQSWQLLQGLVAGLR